MDQHILIGLFLVLAVTSVQAQYRGEAVAAEMNKPAFDLKKDFTYNVDFKNNLAEKFGRFNATGNLFNMTGVATTPFGRLTAWVGDLVYPVALGAVIFFGVYILFQIVFQVFGFALSTKASIFTGLINWLRATNNAIFTKVLKVSAEPELLTPEERQRRDVGMATVNEMIQLASQVYEAIDNFSQTHEE